MARLPLPDPTVVLTCSRCGVSGRACDLFYFVKSGPNAGALTQSWCKTCEYQRVLEHKDRRPKFGPPVPMGARLRARPRRSNLKVAVVDGVEMRRCTRCDEVLPVEKFSVQRRRDVPPRYASHCKACRTAFEKEQRLAGMREIPIEVQRERARRWAKANPEKARMGVRRRRARLRDAGPMLSLAEWLEIQQAWGHRCAYCSVHAPGDLTMDHVIPVARGGDSSVENISPACGPKHNNCNARKAARTGMEFVHAEDGSGPLRMVA